MKLDINNPALVKIGFGEYGYCIKQSPKTSKVQVLTNYDQNVIRVVNKFVTPHNLQPLTKDNADDACVIININHPEWGSKSLYKSGEYYAIDQSILFDDEFKFWVVAEFKSNK